MRRPTTRRSPFWRYTAFQVPSWILTAAGGWWLVTSLDAPSWVAVGLPVAWFVKDMALYPLVRSAYEIDDTPPIARLIGRVGTAAQRLAPRGYVRVRGELWRAETDAGAAVEPEATVEVVGAAGLTLRVRPRTAPDPSVEQSREESAPQNVRRRSPRQSRLPTRPGGRANGVPTRGRAPAGADP